ncbi:hypothetical protein V490_02519 [Pseudogymnoascus sp. VKM F-3557]|nr:hypothetical protein V490_02519 [Pseudogymnoascus sp. VKM F-3557]
MSDIKESKDVVASSSGDKTTNKVSDDQVDNASTEDQKPTTDAAKEGRLVRFRKHLKRRWIYYAIGNTILLAILLPVFFLVIFPAIAQLVLNKSNLLISSVGLSNPAPNSNELSLKASIKLATPLTVHIDPIPLDLFMNDGSKNIVPYTKVVLPENTLHGNSTLSFTDQPAKILNRDIFTEFVRTAMFSEEFTLSVAGPTHAHVGKLKANVNLRKNLKLKGLNSGAGFSIPDAHLVLPPEADGTNLLANLSLPNASVLKMDLGNMTWDLRIGGVKLGNATLQNVILNPGSNIIPARGVLDVKLALKHLRKIIASEKAALKKGDLPISATGNTMVYNGQHIDYYEKNLKKFTLTAPLSIVFFAI